MEVSDDLLCLYNARVTEQNGSYRIEVPKQEIKHGDVQSGEIHRIALISSAPPTQNERTEQDDSQQHPPVEKDDIREVKIEAIGDQGDGIARVERGYVVIVPSTDVGDRVTVRVTEAQENVAFAEVVEYPN